MVVEELEHALPDASAIHHALAALTLDDNNPV